MLPTKNNPQKEQLYEDRDTKKLFFLNAGLYKPRKVIKHHLYILSDEEIKKGDFCVIKNHYKEYYVAKFNGKSFDIINEGGNFNPIKYGDNAWKIVATTDKSLFIEGKCSCMKPEKGGCYQCNKELPKIPESFIQTYIKAYNEGKPIIEVDLEMDMNDTDEMLVNEGYIKDNSVFGIKTNPDNTVIVHENKMYTREEVEEILLKSLDATVTKHKGFRKIFEEQLKNWIQENL